MSKAIYDDVMGDRGEKPRVTDSLAPDYEPLEKGNSPQSEAPSVEDLLEEIGEHFYWEGSEDIRDHDKFIKNYSAKINRLIDDTDLFKKLPKQTNIYKGINYYTVSHGKVKVRKRKLNEAIDKFLALSNNLSKGE